MTTQRGTPPEGYLTATRTKQLLGGISDGMLRVYVNKGLIERYVPAGRRQGFYKQEDVRAMMLSLDNFPRAGKDVAKEHFRQATEEDIRLSMDLIISEFGGSDTSKKRIEWLKRNPETAFVLRKAQEVVGVIFLLPLTKEKVQEIFSLPYSSSTRVITTKDIQPYRIQQEGVSLYIATFVAKKGLNKTTRTSRGALLIRGLYTHLIDLGQRGIFIEEIVGRSDTMNGINLLKKMGFTELEPVGSNRNFIIETQRSGIPFILDYKKALATYREKR